MPEALRLLSALEASRVLRLESFDFGAERWLRTFREVAREYPDLAGRGVVNPFAMLLTLALLLETLGHAEDAGRVEAAVDAAIAKGETTADVGGTLSTVQATDAVLRHVDAAR
jgi:isocitrate/isopropylmalate dehydrogenase